MELKKRFCAFLLLVALISALCAFSPYGAFALKPLAESGRPSLVPGGTPFGIKFFTRGVVVAGVTDIETYDGLASPAKDAGIRSGDIIAAVNGMSVNTAEELGEAVASSRGDETVFTVKRGGESFKVTLRPVRSAADNVYRAGLWVRDSTAGIGTVTYVDSRTGEFGGLGHGICDTETGDPLPLLRGVVTDVTVTGVVKGRANEPGELKGDFSLTMAGTLEKNTECGVFGTLNDISAYSSPPMEICYSGEMKTGKAHILTTVEGETPRLYEIRIVRIYENSGQSKNFLIEVTDGALLEKTGGIVQGMSGSPVIQDGRLCGAVTHVMINDPRRGYGIFIENMLSAAQN